MKEAKLYICCSPKISLTEDTNLYKPLRKTLIDNDMSKKQLMEALDVKKTI